MDFITCVLFYFAITFFTAAWVDGFFEPDHDDQLEFICAVVLWPLLYIYIAACLIVYVGDNFFELLRKKKRSKK